MASEVVRGFDRINNTVFILACRTLHKLVNIQSREDASQLVITNLISKLKSFEVESSIEKYDRGRVVGVFSKLAKQGHILLTGAVATIISGTMLGLSKYFSTELFACLERSVTSNELCLEARMLAYGSMLISFAIFGVSVLYPWCQRRRKTSASTSLVAV